MKIYTIHWTAHPLKDQAWYEAEIRNKMMGPDEVARELDLNFALSVSGKVFTPFVANRHVVDKFHYNKDLPVYRVFDFGRVNCTLYIQRDGHGRTRVLHERILESSSTPEQKAVALEDSRELFEGARFIDICDPAGSDKGHSGADTDVQILENPGDEGSAGIIRPDYFRIREYPTKERKVQARKMVMRDLQSTPGGEEALTIYGPGCPVLVKGFNGSYHYKKDLAGNTLDKIYEAHPVEDVFDCLFYYYLEADGSSHYDDGLEPYYNNDVAPNEWTGF